MSDCSQHKKDLFGQTDMKAVAREVSKLHYKSLADLIYYLKVELEGDSFKDNIDGKEKLSAQLRYASDKLFDAYKYINEAWRISKPFMQNPNP